MWLAYRATWPWGRWWRCRVGPAGMALVGPVGFGDVDRGHLGGEVLVRGRLSAILELPRVEVAPDQHRLGPALLGRAAFTALP